VYPLLPIEHIRRDLVAHLYGMANMLDCCVRHGAGPLMLNFAADKVGLDFPQYDDFDLTGFPAAEGLKAVYRYAAFGEFHPSSSIEHLSLDPNEGALGRMHLLVQTFVGNPEVAYCFDEVTQIFDNPDAPRGGFREMVALAVARATLDDGLNLTAGQVALLANVSERTVANAMATSGESRLSSTHDEAGGTVIKSDEAFRWLSGRRAFVATASLGLSTGLPKTLDAKALREFIVERIREEVPDDGWDFANLKTRGLTSIPGQRCVTICRVLGWSESRAQAWIDGDLAKLDLDDCDPIAGIMGVDGRRLASHLLAVRFPDSDKQLDATLTEAGVRSGYFDIEQRFARRFFPDDAFGGRGSVEIGAPVRLHFDRLVYETDIRVKSQALVSPRKRFTGYFKAHQAKPGDKVRITRISERDYELTFIGASK
jgi:hypothetical protein